MAAKRRGERCCTPGDSVTHGTGKRSTAAAGAVARATFPHGRAGRLHPLLPGPPPQDESEATGLPELQEALYLLITQQWVQTLTGPYDWGNWPLSRYVFGDEFLRDLRSPESIENAAWVCAMLGAPRRHRGSPV